MSGLLVQRIGPVASIQDLGRPGLLGQGVSQGGAADVRGIAEGAALLGQSPELAALEMGGIGGEFLATEPIRIALTGAPMMASIDGSPIVWNASHQLEKGQILSLGAVRKGVYAYLHLGGGIASPKILGARAAHLAAGIGAAVQAGDTVLAGADKGGPVGQVLPVDPRFDGGELRIVESFQSALFAEDLRARFSDTQFQRGTRANRMGVEMLNDGPGFAAEGQLNILSEIISPGDVQMTGDGKPFVLMRECQTTGGYPRIGTVLPCDLPKVAQAPLGAGLRFRWVSLEQGLEAQQKFEAELKSLPRSCQPLVRDPADMQDLLSYQLVGGVVSATSDPFEGE
ncbi:MAG: biotin-dependent carboxyltransferase family protein [Rhodobacteraceae bacterium]|nr:biotin-dependent carboxyltransferase family protein [Paracoccaceae bacterium]